MDGSGRRCPASTHAPAGGPRAPSPRTPARRCRADASLAVPAAAGTAAMRGIQASASAIDAGSGQYAQSPACGLPPCACPRACNRPSAWACCTCGAPACEAAWWRRCATGCTAPPVPAIRPSDGTNASASAASSASAFVVRWKDIPMAPSLRVRHGSALTEVNRDDVGCHGSRGTRAASVAKATVLARRFGRSPTAGASGRARCGARMAAVAPQRNARHEGGSGYATPDAEFGAARSGTATRASWRACARTRRCVGRPRDRSARRSRPLPPPAHCAAW